MALKTLDQYDNAALSFPGFCPCHNYYSSHLKSSGWKVSVLNVSSQKDTKQ